MKGKEEKDYEKEGEKVDASRKIRNKRLMKEED